VPVSDGSPIRPLGARSAGRCRGRAGCTRVGNSQSAPGRGELLLAVILAWLVAAEPRLLLGFEVLLVAAVLELLRVHAELAEQTGVLLRVNLIHPLHLLRSLLVVPAELTRPNSGPCRRQTPWGLLLRREGGWCRARRRGTYTATLCRRAAHVRQAPPTPTGLRAGAAREAQPPPPNASSSWL